jgi:hypothetical protein
MYHSITMDRSCRSRCTESGAFRGTSGVWQLDFGGPAVALRCG